MTQHEPVRPDEMTRIGATVVYDSPSVTAPVSERPRHTFLGIVEDDAEPGTYCWIADQPEGNNKPTVTAEIAADFLILEDR